MSDLTFTVSGDNIVLSAPGGARLEQIGDARWSLVDGAPETIDYLPAHPGGANWHALYGSKRLLPSWTGSAFRGRTPADAPVEIPFSGQDVAAADIVAARGAGTELRLDRWHDQSGNGRDFMQDTAAMRPCVREDAVYNGAPLILIDGGELFPDTAIRGFQATHALPGGNSTWFFVTDYHTSAQAQALVAFEGSSGGAGGRFIRHENGGTPASVASSCIQGYAPGGTSAWPGQHFPVGPTVITIREDAGPVDLFINGALHPAVSTIDMVSTGAPPLAETLTTCRLGFTANSGLTAYNSNMRVLAAGFVDAALSDDDILSITNSFRMIFGMPMRYDWLAIFLGNSIGEGAGARDTLEWMYWLRKQGLKGNPLIYNFSFSGKQLTQAYTDRALLEGSVYRSDIPVRIIPEFGINDIRIASLTGAQLYDHYKDYLAYWHGLGSNVEVIGRTLLKSGLNDTTQAQGVIDFNTLLRANADPSALRRTDALSDVALNELHLAAPGAENDLTLLIDKLHPTSLEYSYLAPIDVAKINAGLP